MPRHHFDITRGGALRHDEIGDEREDVEDARARAQVMPPDIAEEKRPDGDLHQIRCDVRDGAGHIVYRAEITFRGTQDPA